MGIEPEGSSLQADLGQMVVKRFLLLSLLLDRAVASTRKCSGTGERLKAEYFIKHLQRRYLT